MEYCCIGCGCELSQRDVREILANGRPYGPFCPACAQRAEDTPFAQWLDDEWQRQNPH